MFLETHLPEDNIMEGAYRNFSPVEFAEFVGDRTGLTNRELLGTTTRGRSLFKLSRPSGG